MIKRAFKYLVIVTLNLLILTVMLSYWTDSFELTFNDLVRPIEFLKIVGFSILSLIGVRILIGFFRKRSIQTVRKKVKYASLLTLLICSYLYIDYSIKIVKNQYVDRQIRQEIMKKVKPANMLAYGSTADNLTNAEYSVLTDITWFPKLPETADKISYLYTYDGFLPDYTFRLTYEVPADINIEEKNYKKGDFSKSQTFEMKGDRKIVTYEEEQW